MDFILGVLKMLLYQISQLATTVELNNRLVEIYLAIL